MVFHFSTRSYTRQARLHGQDEAALAALQKVTDLRLVAAPQVSSCVMRASIIVSDRHQELLRAIEALL